MNQDDIAVMTLIICKFIFKTILNLAFVYLAMRLSIHTDCYWFLLFLIIPVFSMLGNYKIEKIGDNENVKD